MTAADVPYNSPRARAVTTFGPANLDAVGRLQVSSHQNIFDADFEYGPQPLRWEALTAGGGTVTHLPGQGGVRLQVGTASGDIAMRQSRPYHRYQPGKSMFMASAVLFGAAIANNRQRIGFFDDANGCFWEQADPTTDNPSGMFVVIRSDISGTINETRIPITDWRGPRQFINRIDWNRIQMLFIEYAWYGAGAIRWGIYVEGERVPLHWEWFGNRPGQTQAWARTGNLPVRYETRNLAGAAAGTSMVHWGVSVNVDGRVDDQRGFTYSYGLPRTAPRRTVAAASDRFPVLSVRGRTLGTIEATNTATAGTTTTVTVSGTPWTVNQWVGRYVFFPGLGGGNGTVARITSNTANVLTFADPVTGGAIGNAPAASQALSIGLCNRGQILPRRLLISASALAVVELIASTPSSPVTLTGATFATLASLGSTNSFAERDVSATAMSGGEVVFAFTAPAGGSGLQDIDVSYLLPLLNTIRGNTPDILTLAVSTPAGSASDVGAHLICQEAMS